ncbi:hypothetical protein PROFUN_10503 [Planoprotostelium fungivorum]|uniref:Retrotransposon gag domain-containing protein n=1 Tax=Planoprotostelium fungivorum TaxID=1890364 RepID=A0A2P6NDB1_9EUKA|nr:hypothetical protein PROFUN_10503 [Planoprotostelium fungivorum]
MAMMNLMRQEIADLKAQHNSIQESKINFSTPIGSRPQPTLHLSTVSPISKPTGVPDSIYQEKEETVASESRLQSLISDRIKAAQLTGEVEVTLPIELTEARLRYPDNSKQTKEELKECAKALPFEFKPHHVRTEHVLKWLLDADLYDYNAHRGPKRTTNTPHRIRMVLDRIEPKLQVFVHNRHNRILSFTSFDEFLLAFYIEHRDPNDQANAIFQMNQAIQDENESVGTFYSRILALAKRGRVREETILTTTFLRGIKGHILREMKEYDLSQSLHQLRLAAERVEAHAANQQSLQKQRQALLKNNGHQHEYHSSPSKHINHDHHKKDNCEFTHRKKEEYRSASNNKDKPYNNRPFYSKDSSGNQDKKEVRPAGTPNGKLVLRKDGSLAPEIVQFRKDNNLCTYCGQPAHQGKCGPLPTVAPKFIEKIHALTSNSHHNNLITVKATINNTKEIKTTTAPIDTRATCSCIDRQTATSMKLLMGAGPAVTSIGPSWNGLALSPQPIHQLLNQEAHIQLTGLSPSHSKQCHH